MEQFGSGECSLQCVMSMPLTNFIDDSITLATPSLVTGSSASLSSDDDPHRYVGQVTPHRLVSPAVRRVLDDDPFTEPGSDDSNMSASPTADRVARMSAKRLNVKSTPLKTRLPSLSL